MLGMARILTAFGREIEREPYSYRIRHETPEMCWRVFGDDD